MSAQRQYDARNYGSSGQCLTAWNLRSSSAHLGSVEVVPVSNTRFSILDICMQMQPLMVWEKMPAVCIKMHVGRCLAHPRLVEIFRWCSENNGRPGHVKSQRFWRVAIVQLHPYLAWEVLILKIHYAGNTFWIWCRRKWYYKCSPGYGVAHIAPQKLGENQPVCWEILLELHHKKVSLFWCPLADQWGECPVFDYWWEHLWIVFFCVLTGCLPLECSPRFLKWHTDKAVLRCLPWEEAKCCLHKCSCLDFVAHLWRLLLPFLIAILKILSEWILSERSGGIVWLLYGALDHLAEY